MKKLISIFFTLLLMPILFAKSKKVPVWVTDPYSGYEESKYIAASVSGSTYEEADKNAFSAAAAIIMQNIESEEILSQSANSGGQDISTYLSNVKINSKIKNISGLYIKDRFCSKDGIFYARAVLEKSAAAKNYTLLLNKNILEIETLLENTKDSLPPFERCGNLLKAYKIALDNDNYISLLSVLKPSAKHILPYKNSAEIANKVKNAFNSVMIFIEINSELEKEETLRLYSAASAAVNKFGISSSKLEEGITGSNIQYTLSVNITIEDTENADTYFSRYVLSCILKENFTDKNILTYTSNGRRGKLSKQEARKSALRFAEKSIMEGFSEKFSTLF